MNENWLPVPGYEGLYEVSSLGRLKRISTPTGKPRCKIIKPHMKRDGYADYWVWRNGKKTRHRAHRLVWSTFSGDIPSGMQINHVNGRKGDNHLANLELATRSENAIHSFRVLGRPAPNNPSFGVQNGSSVLTEHDVRTIRSIYSAKQLNQYELAAKFSVSQRTINLVVRRLTWRHIA